MRTPIVNASRAHLEQPKCSFPHQNHPKAKASRNDEQSASVCVCDPIKVGKLASFVVSSKDYWRYLIHEPLNLCCQTTRCIPARTCSTKTAVQHFSQDLGPKHSTSATLTLHIRIHI